MRRVKIIERPRETYSYAAVDQQTGEIPLRLSERADLVALCRRLGWVVDGTCPQTNPARQICGSPSVSATAPIEPAIGLNVDWADTPNIHARGSAGEIVPRDTLRKAGLLEFELS